MLPSQSLRADGVAKHKSVFPKETKTSRERKKYIDFLNRGITQCVTQQPKTPNAKNKKGENSTKIKRKKISCKTPANTPQRDLNVTHFRQKNIVVSVGKTPQGTTPKSASVNSKTARIVTGLHIWLAKRGRPYMFTQLDDVASNVRTQLEAYRMTQTDPSAGITFQPLTNQRTTEATRVHKRKAVYENKTSHSWTESEPIEANEHSNFAPDQSPKAEDSEEASPEIRGVSKSSDSEQLDYKIPSEGQKSDKSYLDRSELTLDTSQEWLEAIEPIDNWSPYCKLQNTLTPERQKGLAVHLSELEKKFDKLDIRRGLSPFGQTRKYLKENTCNFEANLITDAPKNLSTDSSKSITAPLDQSENLTSMRSPLSKNIDTWQNELKENVRPDSDNISTHATALEHLLHLTTSGFSPTASQDWLSVMRCRCPEITDEPLYWECLSAIKNSKAKRDRQQKETVEKILSCSRKRTARSGSTKQEEKTSYQQLSQEQSSPSTRANSNHNSKQSSEETSNN